MKQTILIVDDSPTVRKFVRAAIGLEGYGVIEASNGMEALELLPGASIDMIVTDLNMPDMDGLEFLKTLRESDQYRNVPVIILSSMSDETLQERARILGASAYLIKPFSREALLEIVSVLRSDAFAHIG